MLITVTSIDGDLVAQLAVEPTDTIGSIAVSCHEQFHIPPGQQQLLYNGAILRQDQSFESAGITEDDLLQIRSIPNTQQGGGAGGVAGLNSNSFTVQPGMTVSQIPRNPSPEVLLQIMEVNPHLLTQLRHYNPKLAQALETKKVEEVRMVLLQMHMAEASRQYQEQEELAAIERNPMDPVAQQRIAERIRLNNVQENMAIAMEEMPEAFASVTMLYIPCEVNGSKVKAFVDSGAQKTIMSSGCAERCGIMRFVDTNFSGVAMGVGTAKIIGRVHLVPMKIGNYFYKCSFTIIDQQSVDLLFGLDMLKRHQCSIDLYRNILSLRVGDATHDVPFLPESEIPSSDTAVTETRIDEANATAAIRDAAASAKNEQSRSTTIENETMQDKIGRLIALGFDEQQARQALQSTNGNVDMAAGLLFERLG